MTYLGARLLIYTVTLTESTIYVHLIDMVQAPYYSTSQLLAFLVGWGPSAPVVWAAVKTRLSKHAERNEDEKDRA
jgi:hypothetical protein